MFDYRRLFKRRTLLQINTVVNSGSTGRIAEGIGKVVTNSGWRSFIAYGRWANSSQSELIKIGTKVDFFNHALKSYLFDCQGLASNGATKKLIYQIERLKPDIIHLHNIHGYYLNYPILFDYLSKASIPVVWTLHDCWPITGHCAHFSYVKCERWKVQCKQCPNQKSYPISWCFDNSYQNYLLKKRYFTSVPNLVLVSVSNWLNDLVHDSFFENQILRQIYNGIDTNFFRPIKRSDALLDEYGIPTKNFVLGVTNIWDKRKGLLDFIQLREVLPNFYSIVLVGLNKRQISALPHGIIGIQRTENVESLRRMYSNALAFINPTWEDNFPTTNLEALACGTPVITYRTGGSPEAVTPKTGFVVEQGDLAGIVSAVKTIAQKGKSIYVDACRERVVKYFDQNDRFREYLRLYQTLL